MTSTSKIGEHLPARHAAPRSLGWLALLLLAALWVSAPAQAGGSTLEGIDYTSLSGNRVQVTLKLSAPVEPSSFTIENPARIAFDLPETTNRLAERSLRIGIGAVEGVSTAEAGGRTRVVLRLAQMVSYDMRREGNEIHITLQPPRGEATADSGRSGGTVQPAAALRGDGITDIDFRRDADGTGRIIIALADPSVPVDVREEGGRIIANLMNTRLPQRLERRLDVADFATPVQTIDSRQAGNHVRMVIAATGAFEHMAYQTSDRLTIELKPLTKEEREKLARDQIQYHGDRLSLNFQDIEVRAVLQLISDFTGLNVVVSDSVRGNITLRLQNVPWDQALDIILKSRGLDKRQHGNVLMIGPADEIAAREQQQLKAQKEIHQLEPLRSEFLQVNYARAADIEQLLLRSRVAALMRGGDEEETGARSLLSARGHVTVDTRTNTLILQDTERNLTDIRNLVMRLDIPVRQVLIESRVVIATDDFTRDLGVRFGYGRTGTVGSNHQGTVGGTRPGNINLGTGAFGVPGGLMVDLPATGAGGSVGLAVGRIGTELLQLELSAMETEGRGDIVSSPRVITANQQSARIEQGVEIPYAGGGGLTPGEVQFKKAVLGLDVTPQITPDDRVLLNLHVSKDSQGQMTTAGPVINTQAVTTQVLVDNGETVVLGGVYERTNNNSVRRIPFFGELPLVGALFRTNSQVDMRSELLIFVTPKILQESLTRQ
jgi:type IV pilus assembly protein PilQ